jgi:hypothetical protein
MNALKHSALTGFLLLACALVFVARATQANANSPVVAQPSAVSVSVDRTQDAAPGTTTHASHSHLRPGTDLSTSHALETPTCPQCGHCCQGFEPHAGQHYCDNCHYW